MTYVRRHGSAPILQNVPIHFLFLSFKGNLKVWDGKRIFRHIFIFCKKNLFFLFLFFLFCFVFLQCSCATVNAVHFYLHYIRQELHNSTPLTMNVCRPLSEWLFSTLRSGSTPHLNRKVHNTFQRLKFTTGSTFYPSSTAAASTLDLDVKTIFFTFWFWFCFILLNLTDLPLNSHPSPILYLIPFLLNNLICFLVLLVNSPSGFGNALGGPLAHSESTKTLFCHWVSNQLKLHT